MNYGRNMQPFLNQYYATSGRKPSTSMLNSIIRAELAAAEESEFNRARLAEQKRQFDVGQEATQDISQRNFEEQQRQFNIGQANAMDTAEGARRTGAIGAIAGLGTTAATLRALTLDKGAGFWDFLPGVGPGTETINAIPEVIETAPVVAGEASLAPSATGATSGTPVIAGGATLAPIAAYGGSVATQSAISAAGIGAPEAYIPAATATEGAAAAGGLTAGQIVGGIGLAYGGAKLMEATEGIKEIPKEVAEVGSFVADIVEKPLEAVFGAIGGGK